MRVIPATRSASLVPETRERRTPGHQVVRRQVNCGFETRARRPHFHALHTRQPPVASGTCPLCVENSDGAVPGSRGAGRTGAVGAQRGAPQGPREAPRGLHGASLKPGLWEGTRGPERLRRRCKSRLQRRKRVTRRQLCRSGACRLAPCKAGRPGSLGGAPRGAARGRHGAGSSPGPTAKSCVFRLPRDATDFASFWALE